MEFINGIFGIAIIMALIIIGLIFTILYFVKGEKKNQPD